ncbi:hypothetical protein ABPG72_005217 [Tetrahymena utriculariae]
MLLDPRFKLMFQDEFIYHKWKKELKQEYIAFIKQNQLNQSNDTNFKNIPPSENIRIGNKLLSQLTPNYTPNTLFQNQKDQFKKINIVNTNDGIQYDSEEYINECTDYILGYYFTQPLISWNQEISSFWKQMSNKFPNFCKLAKRYLCIPPISSKSERALSSANSICGKLRNRSNQKN